MAEEESTFKKHEFKIIIGSCVTAAALFIASFGVTASYVNNKETKQEVTSQIVKVLILTIVGTILFSVAVFIIYSKNSTYTYIPLVLLSTLAVGLSYAALCIASISANSLG